MSKNIFHYTVKSDDFLFYVVKIKDFDFVKTRQQNRPKKYKLYQNMKSDIQYFRNLMQIL